MPRPRIEIEPPPAWFSLADMIDQYRDEHPELDDINDIIEALIWGYGEEEEDDNE